MSLFHSTNIVGFNCTYSQQQMSCVPSFVLKRQGQPVNDLTFWNRRDNDEDNLKLITAYRGGVTDVDIWLMKTRRVVASIEAETGATASVLSVAEFNDHLVTLDRDGWLKLYDGNTMARKTKLGLGDVGFCKASVLRHNPSMLVALPGDTKSSVTIWSLRDTCIATRLLPPAHLDQLGMVMSVQLLSDRFLVAGYEDGSVLLWNVPECKVQCSALSLFQEPVMALDAWLAGGDVIECVCASVGNQLTRLRFDVSVNDVGLARKDIELVNEGVSCVRIRNDGKLFASAGWDFKVRVFGMKKMKPLAVLDYHNAAIHSVDFADRWDGDNITKYLACSSKDNKVSVYNIFN